MKFSHRNLIPKSCSFFEGSMTSENQPTVFARLNSIGSVTLEDNRKTLTAITKLLEEELKISKSEIRIVFHDLENPDNVGLAGLLITDHK